MKVLNPKEGSAIFDEKYRKCWMKGEKSIDVSAAFGHKNNIVDLDVKTQNIQSWKLSWPSLHTIKFIEESIH